MHIYLFFNCFVLSFLLLFFLIVMSLLFCLFLEPEFSFNMFIFTVFYCLCSILFFYIVIYFKFIGLNFNFKKLRNQLNNILDCIIIYINKLNN